MPFDSRDDELTVFSALRGTAGWIGEMIVANPASVGAATAFGVAMTFFTANAVYFQESPHPSALFATRPETVRIVTEDKAAVRNVPVASRFESGKNGEQTTAHAVIPQSAPIPVHRPEIVPPGQTPDPVELASGGEKTVATIQELLAKLGYYDGEVDGLRGPMTNAAVETYKQNAGLRGIELDDAELTTSMRNHLDVTAGIPAPKPAPARPESGESVAELIARDTVPLPLPTQIPSAEVVKVQAALKALGNTDVVVDGIAGAQTESAIREFQVLFRLPVNGEIDGALLDKMRSVGLIQ